MLDELEVRPGHPVLDLGCGPGTDPGALAEAVTAAGEVIGVDHDRAAVDTAEPRTLGVHAVTVRRGDIHDLPQPDRTAEPARNDRVLQHIADPVRIGRQLARLSAEAGFTVPTVVPVSSDFRDVRAAGRILGLELTTRRTVVATGCFTEEGARSRLHHLSSCPFLAAMTLHIVVAEP
ncbi:methyltransferase domain-containing protein [Streptomyces sp. NPDC056638]|uniref:methyltransferase domain-containing protein n=1 Tax=Streptomyces sp. NPDC056638 TaxID=3345887 RepID=UPI0036ADBF1A